MRFYNDAAELRSAVDACPPLLSLMALNSAQIRPTANRKVWIIEGRIVADGGRKKIQQQLSEVATNISLKPATKNGMISCKLMLHAANQELLEAVMMAYSSAFRMTMYNQQVQADINKGEKTENYSSFQPERRFNNSFIRHHYRNNKWRPAFTLEPIDPASLSARTEEKPKEAPPQRPDNVTPFRKVMKTSKTEKPGT